MFKKRLIGVLAVAVMVNSNVGASMAFAETIERAIEKSEVRNNIASASNAMEASKATASNASKADTITTPSNADFITQNGLDEYDPEEWDNYQDYLDYIATADGFLVDDRLTVMSVRPDQGPDTFRNQWEILLEMLSEVKRAQAEKALELTGNREKFKEKIVESYVNSPDDIEDFNILDAIDDQLFEELTEEWSDAGEDYDSFDGLTAWENMLNQMDRDLANRLTNIVNNVSTGKTPNVVAHEYIMNYIKEETTDESPLTEEIEAMEELFGIGSNDNGNQNPDGGDGGNQNPDGGDNGNQNPDGGNDGNDDANNSAGNDDNGNTDSANKDNNDDVGSNGTTDSADKGTSDDGESNSANSSNDSGSSSANSSSSSSGGSSSSSSGGSSSASGSGSSNSSSSGLSSFGKDSKDDVTHGPGVKTVNTVEEKIETGSEITTVIQSETGTETGTVAKSNKSGLPVTGERTSPWLITLLSSLGATVGMLFNDKKRKV